jgi:sugar phosphate isomerase/epimerase
VNTSEAFRVGVCTWIFADQPLPVTAGRLAGLGFDGVELLGDLSLYSAKEAARVLDDHGLQPFSLTPENVDLSHPDDSVRRSAVDYFYRLIDFAAEFELKPLVSCHGIVGRIAPISSMVQENDLLIQSVHEICWRAKDNGLLVVYEVLNRYETHQIHTGAQALELIDKVGLDNLGVLLDAYHMNIEESVPSKTIEEVGSRLWLYHAADSNRRAIGLGHTDFARQLGALRAISYTGPIILECTAPGPNPFTSAKAEGWRSVLEEDLALSVAWLAAN